MKKSNFAVLLVSAVICTAVPQISPIPTDVIVAEAHGGRTDANGGHKDSKNKSGLGSYHYHCGSHPAHLHTDGVCPYSSGSTATSSASQTASSDTGASDTGTSDTIKQVQQALNDLGYDAGEADGVMGQKTKAAVEQFQKDNGLVVDGIIGKQVKDKLGIS